MVAMIRRIVILAIGLFGWLSVSCSEDASVHVDPCAEVDSLASAGQYEKAVSLARSIYDSARMSGNRREAVASGARLGRLYYMTFSPDSMYYYFDDVTQDAEELEMYQECIIIHNIIGVSVS